MIALTRLTPCFAARIDGVDITRPADDDAWSEIRAHSPHKRSLLRLAPLRMLA